jgi:hypothetical protein
MGVSLTLRLVARGAHNSACRIQRDLAAEGHLADGLVDGGADGGGEVEGALADDHGEGDEAIGVGFEDGWGQAAGFFAEDEVVAGVELDLPGGAGGFGGEDPSAALSGWARGVAVGGPGLVLGGPEARPVVEACAAAGLLGGIKAEGLDEMEGAPRSDAGAADVARVVRDLRLVEDDVEQGIGRRGMGGGGQDFFSEARRAFTPGSTSMSLAMVSSSPA